MSNKRKQMSSPVYYSGYIATVPSSPLTKLSTYEKQTTSKSLYKDTFDGSNSATKYSHTQKGGDFIDRRSGNTGYRDELQFKKTETVTDKARGFTKKYETEFKFKETTTYHKDTNKSYLGGSGSGYDEGRDYDSDHYDDRYEDYSDRYDDRYEDYSDRYDDRYDEYSD